MSVAGFCGFGIKFLAGVTVKSSLLSGAASASNRVTLAGLAGGGTVEGDTACDCDCDWGEGDVTSARREPHFDARKDGG